MTSEADKPAMTDKGQTEEQRNAAFWRTVEEARAKPAPTEEERQEALWKVMREAGVDPRPEVPEEASNAPEGPLSSFKGLFVAELKRARDQIASGSLESDRPAPRKPSKRDAKLMRLVEARLKITEELRAANEALEAVNEEGRQVMFAAIKADLERLVVNAKGKQAQARLEAARKALRKLEKRIGRECKR